jgi:heme o synthase
MKTEDLIVREDLMKFRRIILTAAIVVFIVIVAGGIVRVSNASEGCAGWPECQGGWLPPMNVEGLVDYFHRAGSLILLPLFAGLGWFTWKRFRNINWIKLPVTVALLLLILQILWGGFVALQPFSGDRQPLTAVHFGISLLILAAILIPVVVSYYLRPGEDRGVQAEERAYFMVSPFARLTLATLGSVFLLLVSGAVVSAAGLAGACPGWPLCDGFLWPTSSAQWLQMAHRVVTGLATVLVSVQLIQAWRTQKTQVPILVASTSVAVLFFSQALLGGLKVAQGFPGYMAVLHEATASAVWAGLIVQATAVGLAARMGTEEAGEAAKFSKRSGLARDFLMLTKPVVVLLLLVTTFAGMAIGAKEIPGLSLVFWTLIGGAMAAGGSGAINQYIDRFDDRKMQRTERRPIPSGRLTPGEGLAFGVGLCLASFYLVVAFVNLLAALLVLAGIIYYVLIYSIFLKKATVQNIVIGGGAGAIPPLVGWAAATGSLNIPSLFLFAVVFMWTPPHFWALALVRSKDYARANVPMLPVVKGEAETRWQIFIYTIELVALTLLLPLFGLGGGIYIVSAVVLGGGLLASAWRVWRRGGNKLAWKMYRHSSMYLAFIFLALVVDALI